MIDKIRAELESLSEEKYRLFSSSLIPGKANILGVRLPLLRKMAKEIAKNDWRLFLKEAGEDSLEELMLQGMVIGNLKVDIEEVLKLASDFIPKIDNWSVCDSFCCGLKITEKHRERVWEFIKPYLNSNREFEIRFGVVMILNYYVLPDYVDQAFHIFNEIKHEGYYVKMAVAWAISYFFNEFPEKTMAYLENNHLDQVTYNKALQKILESRKTKEIEKNKIRSMRR